MTIRESVEGLIRDRLGWRGPLPQDDLAGQLDSMQRLTLVVAVEDHFRVCLDPEDEQRIRSLDDLVAAVAAKRAEQSPAD